MKKQDLHSRCYSPYSNTQEACYVEGESGMFYEGVRIENISFPLSISAIQAAVTSCLGNADTPVKLYQAVPGSELKEYWLAAFSMDEENNLPDNPPLFNPVLSNEIDIQETLKRLCDKAVTIHSDFPVSTLLEINEGYIPGVNVEVCAWSLGLCAERVALSRAISAGYNNYRKMHIYAPKSLFSSPCGACRQVLAEHMPNKTVELHHKQNNLSKHFTNHLLPYGFITESLNK